jgi:L-lactate dehydrogenase complex protein LldG
MNRARDDILAAMRARLGARPAAPTHAGGYRSVLPLGFVRNAPDLTLLFLEKFKQSVGSVSHIQTLAELPHHVAALLGERGLGPQLSLAPEPSLQLLGWSVAGLTAGQSLDPLRPGTVVSRAAAAIAETGSLVFSTAGASRPTHNLLAEFQIVVLEPSQIVATPEAAWLAATGAGVPRGLVFVTGPSRTGDIEMTLELGAHGAVSLHIVLLAAAAVAD